MFAINHALTALPLKRAFPDVSLPILLGSVQLVEIGWVSLNLLGVERVVTEPTVRSVADIHLAHMPWSHSVATSLGAALLAGAVASAWSRRVRTGVAVALGVLSHLVLDVLTHAPDIPLAPGLEGSELGLGLYAGAPLLAFGVELGWGLLCWRTYGGARGLLAAVVGFNLANFTLYTPAVVGLEGVLAGRPLAIVALIGTQIAFTLALVGWLGRDQKATAAATTRRRAA